MVNTSTNGEASRGTYVRATLIMKKHPAIIQIIGWSGTVVLIGAYALNSFGVLESRGLLYPLLNLFAAVSLGIRVWADRNYSNLILEIFWGGVACIAFLRIFL